MTKIFKYLLFVLLLGIVASNLWGQTPQTNTSWTLYTDHSSTFKIFVAREYIILGNGFKFTAIPGQSFIARIDKNINIVLPNGNVLRPDGVQVTPDQTIITPDGTQTKLDGTIISPEGTVFKTNGIVINPDGTKLNVSSIAPEVWFKTVPVSVDVNGRYKWKDFTTNNVALVKYSTNNITTEYTVRKDSVRHFNFNPAIDLTSENISKEIKLATSNLAQATILGVWGSRNETPTTNKFIFAINGRRNESILFSKNTIYSSVESGSNSLPYGNEKLKNLLAVQTNNTSAIKARESALRIASYFKSNMPNTTLWGEAQKATISLGGTFQNSNINNTSTFSTTLNNFEGFKGYTPELLIFSKALQPAERSVFESYLAIKYGVSLEKSYLSAKGKIIWNYFSNSTHNNRITGYGREDLLGLDQKMATSSYQESPYYSDIYDSYFANNLNNLSSRNRLIVMGCQTGSPMNDGEYVLFGDNNGSLSVTNTSKPEFKTMQRSWLVSNINRTTKNWIELSYFDSLATELATHKYDAYLIVDRSGKGDFNSASDAYLISSLDEARYKLIFNNIVWDTDKNGKDAFTFGYKLPPGQVKKLEEDENNMIDAADYMRIYYPDPRILSTVTLKIQNSKPSPTVIIMFDITGRQIYRNDLPESDGLQFVNINLPETGIYIVKVITNQREYLKKIISKK